MSGDTPICLDACGTWFKSLRFRTCSSLPLGPVLRSADRPGGSFSGFPPVVRADRSPGVGSGFVSDLDRGSPMMILWGEIPRRSGPARVGEAAGAPLPRRSSTSGAAPVGSLRWGVDDGSAAVALFFFSIRRTAPETAFVPGASPGKAASSEKLYLIVFAQLRTQDRGPLCRSGSRDRAAGSGRTR
jgi:hypothetical protein